MATLATADLPSEDEVNQSMVYSDCCRLPADYLTGVEHAMSRMTS